jgi:DNA uptake protein ComE-like DNA-binding protein
MLRVIKNFLVNHFAFTYSETKAFLILLGLLLISLIMMIVLPKYLSQSYDNFAEDKKNLELYLAEMEDNKRSKEAKQPMNLQPFNPNTVNKSQLLAMNIPPKVINNLLKYRQKGGYFSQKDEFRKIYGLTDSLYIIIAPYLNLDKENLREGTTGKEDADSKNEIAENDLEIIVKTNPKKIRKEHLFFDINTADTAVLKKIYGVGDVLSNRIVKYRELLGGFVSKQQLKEVYGLSPETVDNISQRCFVGDHFEPVKIKINFATVAELKRHPYLSYDDAVGLVNYRSQHGPFQDVQDLRESKVFSEHQLKLITRYISF